MQQNTPSFTSDSYLQLFRPLFSIPSLRYLHRHPYAKQCIDRKTYVLEELRGSGDWSPGRATLAATSIYGAVKATWCYGVVLSMGQVIPTYPSTGHRAPIVIFRCVRKITKSDYQLRHVRPPVRPSVCLQKKKNSAPTGRICMKFDIAVIFENLPRTFKFHCNVTRITGTLHEDKYTFLIISRSFILTRRNVSDKICSENQNTYFMFNEIFSNILLFMK